MRLFDIARRRLPPSLAAILPARPDGRRSVSTRIGARTFKVASDDHYLDRIQGKFGRTWCACSAS